MFILCCMHICTVKRYAINHTNITTSTTQRPIILQNHDYILKMKNNNAIIDKPDDDAPPFQLATPPGFSIGIARGNSV